MTDPALEAVLRRNEERLAAERNGFIGGALPHFDIALLIDRLNKAEAKIAQAKVEARVFEEYASNNRYNSETSGDNEVRKYDLLGRAYAFDLAAQRILGVLE